MATNSTPVSNITGLASGLDTNSIVTKLMQIERQPQTRMVQRQVVYTARQQALKDINTRLANLQTSIAACAILPPGPTSRRSTRTTRPSSACCAPAALLRAGTTWPSAGWRAPTR